MRWKLRTFTLIFTLFLTGAQTADAGILQRLWELEKAKNQWLLEFFFGRRHSNQHSHQCYECHQ